MSEPDWMRQAIAEGILTPIPDDVLNARPIGRCNRCQRQTWAMNELGTEDRMTQPDGNPCGGRFEPR